MINLLNLNRHRIQDSRTPWFGDENHGAFMILCPVTTRTIKVVASSGYGWDHVSASVHGIMVPPTWAEMEFVRRLFFLPDEAVMQYHAPVADYVNGEDGSGHPGCLHLWRPYDTRAGTIPTPPKWMVGGVSHAEADAAADASEAAGLGPKIPGAYR